MPALPVHAPLAPHVQPVHPGAPAAPAGGFRVPHPHEAAPWAFGGVTVVDPTVVIAAPGTTMATQTSFNDITRVGPVQIVAQNGDGSRTHYFAGGRWEIHSGGQVIRSGNDGGAHWRCFAAALPTIGMGMTTTQGAAALRACGVS